MKKEEISLQTKQSLATSLKRFMKSRAFDKITIHDLLEDCNISRPTFYYHFQDIYALLEWTFEREAVELLRKSENLYTWDDGVLLLLRYVQENKAVCLCALQSLGRNALERMFYQDTLQIMLSFIHVLLLEIPAKQEHVGFIAEFYTRAFVSELIAWMLGGMKQTPEQMVDLIDIAMNGNIKEALKRSAVHS